MRRALRRMGMASATAAALVAAGWGCGGGRPPVDTSTTEANVSGKVLIKGKPASGNTISFDPSNIERKFEPARSTEIGADGSYSITTLVGQNQVSFSGPTVNQYPEIANESFMHTIDAGENTIDFDLPSENPAGP